MICLLHFCAVVCFVVVVVVVFYLVRKDKESSIPHDELGRNITTVQVLQRKHETFERELTALGNKVCNLKANSVRENTRGASMRQRRLVLPWVEG